MKYLYNTAAFKGDETNGFNEKLLERLTFGDPQVQFVILSDLDYKARIRDVFTKAKELGGKSGKPCVIFIANLDTISARGRSYLNDESMVSLLMEMDGIQCDDNIVVVAPYRR